MLRRLEQTLRYTTRCIVPMTGKPTLRLRNAPIVEAVFDADCDLPGGFDLAPLEARVRQQFGPTYPKFETQFLQASLTTPIQQ
jgi:hypothetical protein